MEKLFIYGTLGPGGPNEHIMIKIGGTWTAATLKGHLKAEGWGADMGYPGLTLDAAGDDIEGHIFTSENLKDHWAFLDEFEGEGYQRILADVVTKDGKADQAYVYALNDK